MKKKTVTQVATTSVYLLSKETLGVLYWIGTWSLIMPAKEDNRVTAWVCFGIGIVGVSVCIVADQVFGKQVATAVAPPSRAVRSSNR